MSDKRGKLRTAFRARIVLKHPEVGEYEVATRDMSNTGLFLVWDEPLDLKVGDTITVQTLDIEDAPIISALIVRVETGGFAVTYVFDE